MFDNGKEAAKKTWTSIPHNLQFLLLLQLSR